MFKIPTFVFVVLSMFYILILKDAETSMVYMLGAIVCTLLLINNKLSPRN
jgi:hypothetical protein